MLRSEQMIMIGSSGRNAGKTTVAKALVHAFKSGFNIAVLKITCVSHRGRCPHGTEGCGICSNLQSGYELIEETNPGLPKDTSELLAAGAARVFWLKSFYESLETGYADFCTRIAQDTLVICESNSLRKTVDPGCFIMIINSKHKTLKPTAQEVISFADITLPLDDSAPFSVSGWIDRLNIKMNNSRVIISVNNKLF